MERVLPTLDQMLEMARSNKWDERIWKPAFWHELRKNKYAKTKAYPQVVKWTFLTLFWPVSVVYLALRQDGSFWFVVVYTLLGMLWVRADLNQLWSALHVLKKMKADQTKLGEIWDRYYEHFGEMLDPSEANHGRA